MQNTAVTHRPIQWCCFMAALLMTMAAAQDSLVTKLPAPYKYLQ